MNWTDRFWEKVDMSGDCWEWTASKTHNGYGQCSTEETRVARAHRVSYELTVGEIPDGMFVCHTCDNRACVNPNHLFLGTPGDNSRDAVSKGRMLRGSKVSAAKLTEDDVVRIRDAHRAGARQVDLCAAYGMSPTTICHVVNRKSWRHVS